MTVIRASELRVERKGTVFRAIASRTMAKPNTVYTQKLTALLGPEGLAERKHR
jgi:hypothetical protein